MTQDEFEEIFETVTGMSREVLVEKAKEYAVDGDRMHNFKLAASLTAGGTPEEALWGFLIKHLISLRDMIMSGKQYSQPVWDEKCGDAINYFILLRALVVETGSLVPVETIQNGSIPSLPMDVMLTAGSGITGISAVDNHLM